MPLHEPTACEGQHCCIHNPSDHHMADWPKVWRNSRYLMERTCPHGVGHPDPDHVAHMRRKHGSNYNPIHQVHGCDGCCLLATGGPIPTTVNADTAAPWADNSYVVPKRR